MYWALTHTHTYVQIRFIVSNLSLGESLLVLPFVHPSIFSSVHPTPNSLSLTVHSFLLNQRIMEHFDMNGDAEIEKEEFKHVGLILLSNQKFRWHQNHITRVDRTDITWHLRTWHKGVQGITTGLRHLLWILCPTACCDRHSPAENLASILFLLVFYHEFLWARWYPRSQNMIWDKIIWQDKTRHEMIGFYIPWQRAIRHDMIWHDRAQPDMTWYDIP